jgi:hypothetical protein
VGRRSFHLVQRAGEPSPAFGTISLAPGASRQLQVRLIYPADATPPQVLTLLPLAAPLPPLPGKMTPLQPDHIQPPGGLMEQSNASLQRDGQS